MIGASNARQQVWVFDTEAPFGAVELSGLSGFNSSARSLVPAQDHLGALWGRAESGNLLAVDVNYLAIQQDLVDDLTESNSTSDLALGSLAFVPSRAPDASGSNAAPPGLIYVVGTTGPAGNPTNSNIFYVPLNGTPDQVGVQLGGLSGELIYVFHVDLP